MSLPPFGPDGHLPEGLYRITYAAFFTRFGHGTPQRERVAAQLQQVLDLVRPLEIITCIIVWGSLVSAKPEPGDADILWITRPYFERSRLPAPIAVLFDPVLARHIYGIDVLSLPEGSAALPPLLDGLAVTRVFTKRGLVEVHYDSE